jgi:chemotaxis signal transduction protein
MLPGRIGGVANQHGDALPVVHGEPLLGLERIDATAPTHLLVLARDLDDPDRYGLPVDRVHGLVDGPVPPAAEDGVIAERRPVEGRLMNVLDAKRLLERAVSVIEQSMTAGGRNNGGES